MTDKPSNAVKKFSALQTGFLTEESGNGKYRIVIGFKTLEDRNSASDELRTLLVQPAEQRRGEPVAYAVFSDNGNIRIWSSNCEAVGIKVMQEEGKQAFPLYTHSDAGEVERMRAELAESENLRDQAIIDAANNLDLATNLDKENDGLRAQLAERDAQLIGYKSLLRQVIPCLAMSTNSQSASYMRQIEEALSASAEPSASKLAVWYGSMPESNGKTNWTAILHRGDISEGITIERSEYPGRVRYEADRFLYMIGELTENPCVIDYDTDAHSGYKPSAPVELDEQVKFMAWANKEYEVAPDEELNLKNPSVRDNKIGWLARAALERKP